VALHYHSSIFWPFFHTQIFQFHSNFLRLCIVILILPLSENFPMLLEWFIPTHIITVACCSILFGQTYTCYIHLYPTISTIISLTIYTRLVFQLYHINFVSYLLCPLRFDIIVNRQFCLQLFQCRILIINTGYSLKNHPINRQSRSCSTVMSVFYDSITRPSKWKKITTLPRLLFFFFYYSLKIIYFYT